MFAAFVFLPTRFWPRTDRELPFLAIALDSSYFRTPRVPLPCVVCGDRCKAEVVVGHVGRGHSWTAVISIYQVYS